MLLERACRGDWDRKPLRAVNAPRLSAAVERAMAPEPRDRYIDADAMAGDLERFLHRPRKLKRTAVAAGAILGLLLIGGAGWRWGWRPHRPLAQPVAWMVPAPDDTWDSEGDYTIVRVSQLHVQNAAGRPCLLRATLQAAGAAGTVVPLAHGDYAFTPHDDDAALETIKVPVPRKQLGVRPGEERVFQYTLDLLDQVTMLPIGSAATSGETRIAEFPNARITQVRVPFLAAHLADLYMNVVLETQVQSESETVFEVYVRANCDDPERTPVVRKQDGRPVAFKREIRARTGKVNATVPLRVEEFYPALGDDSWGDVWITARVYDSQNRRWAQDEKSGQIWEKLHVLRVPPGTTQPAAPDETTPAPAVTQPLGLAGQQ